MELLATYRSSLRSRMLPQHKITFLSVHRLDIVGNKLNLVRTTHLMSDLHADTLSISVTRKNLADFTLFSWAVNPFISGFDHQDSPFLA